MNPITFNRAGVKGYNPPSKTALTHTDTFIRSQLNETLKETEQLVQTYTIKESIQFVLWNDLMNKHTLNGLNYDTYQGANARSSNPIRYATGRKVFVDYGYGVDRELFQPHPAIVLGDFNELLVVVPTNSDEGSKVSGTIEKALIRVPNDNKPTTKKPVFPKDTIINLHQVRHISKNRVVTDLRANVKSYEMPQHKIDQLNRYLPYPVLKPGDNLHKVIMVKLAHLYFPDILFENKRLQDQITELEANVKLLTSQLTAMGQVAASLTLE